MKFLRNTAYALIVLCAVGCIVILTYNGKKSGGKENTTTVAITETTSTPEVVIDDGRVDLDDVIEAVSVIISDVKADVKEVVASVPETENKSGEISYAEIVRLQEEEVALTQKILVAESNAAHGISVSGNNSTITISASTDPNYNFAVNKTTKKIHKIGCLLEPTGTNAAYYETMVDVVRAGYAEKCSVCSP